MRNAAFLTVVVVVWASNAIAAAPDTMLGIRDQFGQIYLVDDDGSPVGNGMASGLFGVLTNSGSIDFAVTGNPDAFFVGAHTQSGLYEVFVDVYDFFFDPIVSFSEVHTLVPGTVDEYTFSDFAWIGGTYDVYINNTVPEPSGVAAAMLAMMMLARRRRRTGSAAA